MSATFASAREVINGAPTHIDDLGTRVCVVGMGGKTSLSRAIGATIGVDAIHLDEICWMPEWTLRDKQEQLAMMAQAVETRPQGWVLDGNLSLNEAADVLPQANTVIWLRLPHFATWRNITIRSIKRAWFGRRVCGENYETFLKILGPNSMIWWSLFHLRRSRRKVGSVLAETPHQARIYRIETYEELNAIYEMLGADPADYRAP